MDANIAIPAALIADPARAAILVALLDGRTQPAGALAYASGLSPQAASNHLARLLKGGLVRVRTQGRHRYYSLADARVAAAIESLAGLAPAVRSLEAPRSPKARALRQARSCYDHLAGRLGVAVSDALAARGVLEDADDRYRVTAPGRVWFARFGVELDRLSPGAKGIAGRCIDWTERRGHLGGPLGRALFGRMLGQGWLERRADDRAVTVTPAGRRGLRDAFGLDVSSDGVQADIEHRCGVGERAH
jgi:DNA-binding transcriptional ArsR family regulator